MANTHCFYTSFNKAYLSQALILADSLRKVYAGKVDIVALVVDELEDHEYEYFGIFDQVILAKDLEIPNFKSWIFGLNIVEAATAVKPFGLCQLLQNYSHVTYMDPDTMIYSPLDEIVAAKEEWDIALTPHQISPQMEDWVVLSTEMESLKFGVFNLGFLSVKATAQGKKIAEWWRDRCYEYCVEDVERGLFTDQKLFDLAPAIFSGVHVLRHPGYNVATWNICERNLSFDEKTGVSVNKFPLRFCHFTKATHIGAAALDKMLTGVSLFEEVFYSYVARLQGKKSELSKLSTKWSYGFYDDGDVVLPDARKSFRKLGKSRFKVENPFKNAITFDTTS